MLYSLNKNKYFTISDFKCSGVDSPYLILFECKELEKCKLCNKESVSKNLCMKCNNQKGYYLLNIYTIINQPIDNIYFDCINENKKPQSFYFDNENKDYRPCFELCLTCDCKGNEFENNCTSCQTNYILKPDYTNSKNCVSKCSYYYYYNNLNQYRCTSGPECNEDYYLFIKEKGKYIDNCMKDDTYQYQYSGKCLKECPINTNHNENEYLCRDKNLNKCILSINEYNYINDNMTDNEIEKLTKVYAKEFSYIVNHLSLYKNNIYSIIIYKNGTCINDLSLEFPEIDFGKCYTKIKNNSSIKEELIIAIILKRFKNINNSKMIGYSMYNPNTGEKLNTSDICKDDNIIIQENLYYKLNSSNFDIDINSLKYLAEQDINIFNLSSPFYKDICYHFDSPVEGKDISLKDRIILYYPNITLCEEDCQIIGINLTIFKAKCECKFNNLIDNNLLSNVLSQDQLEEIENILNKTNIQVLRCIKDIFTLKYFKTCTGGYIIIAFIMTQILLTIFFYWKNFYSIRKYIFNTTSKYISYLSNRNKNIFSTNIEFDDNKLIISNNPPKKRKKKGKDIDNNNIETNKDKNAKSKINTQSNNYSIIFQKNNYIVNTKNSNKINKENNINSLDKDSSNINEIKNSPKINNNFKYSLEEIDINSNDIISKNKKIEKYQSPIGNNIIINQNDLNNINMEEYLNTDPDDMDFDDSIKNDKRSFCQFFVDKLKRNQIMLNTFYAEDPIKPRYIKILLFILDICLYLFINGLFFNENYISEILNLKGDDNFLKFIERFTSKFVYITLVGIIIDYIIDFCFVDENKIKGIFRREKDNLVILKYEISRIIKNIIIRYNLFIIFCFLINIFILIYVLCFNIVYPSMKNEWIISSVIIIIIMQILSILKCILETIIRFISFKCKSERIYNISLLLS